jgi:hypothetical protein
LKLKPKCQGFARKLKIAHFANLAVLFVTDFAPRGQ